MALPDTFDDYLIEPLGKQDRAAFSCDVEKLDIYLKQQAGQDARKRMAAPFVLIEKVLEALLGITHYHQQVLNLMNCQLRSQRSSQNIQMFLQLF